ncbi:MAG: DnaD domain protein [Oscillospiraceae bacterium]|nr:DnaD domain protein [Oscillospiraceae bacterium]
MIKLKCDYTNGAVAVPTEILDKHLKLAPAASFKVLLFLFRNPGSTENAEQIAKGTGISKGDAEACLTYWQNCGIIEYSDETVSTEEIEKTLGNAKSVENAGGTEKTELKVKVKSLPVKKPTQREIAKRLSEEPELVLVCNEAQSILGVFGYDTQALLVMIYDYYGFPPEVIITLLNHQKKSGRTSSVAIKNAAEDWAKRGIDSLDLVEKELLALEKIDKLYESIKDTAGLTGDVPTPRVLKFLRTWVCDYEVSAELVKYALGECRNVLSDTNKLLKKYVNSGITTPAEAMERQKKSLPKEVEKTYDINNIGKNSVAEWIKKYAAEEGSK